MLDRPTHQVSTPAVPYHRLALEGPRTRWWTPPITLALAVVLWLAIFVIGSMGAGLAWMAQSGQDPFADANSFGDLSLSDPFGLALGLMSIALMMPAVFLAVRIVEGRGPGTLSSVVGHLRWPLLTRCMALAIPVMAVASVPGIIGAVTGSGDVPAELAPALLASVLVILVVVPFQCAAEEYVFRGLLVQEVGVWTRQWWIPVLVQIPVFALGHEYGWKGLLDVSIFAAIAGWLTIRTSGLEAGIALHVVSNLVAFGSGAAGWSDPASDDVSVPSLALTVACTLVYAVLVDLMGSQREWWPGTPASTGRGADCL